MENLPILSEPPSHSIFKSLEQRVKAHKSQILLITAMLVGSTAIRVAAWMWWHTGAIEIEGAEYASIAAHLLHGRGYVGIGTPGVELMFPPLFPVLIATASLVTHNLEFAARLVAFIFGALLPLPVFALANHLFNRRIAILAATFAIVHPLFVNLSIAVFSEGPYITLFLSSAYLALRALDQPSTARWFWVGFTFGAAYLIRQEAVSALVLVLLFGLFSVNLTLKHRFKNVLVSTAAFLTMALPVIILLYQSTGKLRLEGKSSINYALGIRTLNYLAQSGESDSQNAANEACYSIGADLQATGVCMRSNADVIRETHVEMGNLVRYATASLRRNGPNLVGQLSAKYLGAPFLPSLALLGLASRRWSKTVFSQHMLFLLLFTTCIVPTFSVVHAIYPRNYFVLVPFLVIWAANGALHLAHWANANLRTVTGAKWTVPGAALVSVILVAAFSYALQGTRSLFLFQEGSPTTQPVKDAAQWIHNQQNGPIKIMDVPTSLAFHANADYVPFPYCSGQLALRFLEKADVDYIVLRPGVQFTRYYLRWLNSGIPDARASLVYSNAAGNANGVLVFRWKRSHEQANRRSREGLLPAQTRD
jgi:dolichyl-phosphate-mannose-protein mannosyltransferase